MIATRSGPWADVETRARTLGERLHRPRGESGPGPANPAAARSLEAWKAVIANGDAAGFAKRLGWDELDAGADPADLFSAPDVEEPPAPWVEILRACYGETPADTAAAFEAETDGRAEPDAPLPFQELFAPLVRLARDRVAARAGDARDRLEPAAHASLEHALLKRLTHVCARALHAEYMGFRAVRQNGLAALFGAAPPGGGFRAFMAGLRSGGFLRFLCTYPVAARLCGTVTGLWIDATVEFLERLAEDAPGLARTFAGGRDPGPVSDVVGGVSDPHLGGRTVLIVHFASGLRVVYKPRPIGMERFFTEVVGSVNRAGGLHRLRTLVLFSRPTHGWVEFAEHRDCDDPAAAARYFERCGMLLCLAHVLGANDFHSENLIACGEDPVLIDMEGLATPRFPLVEELATVAMQGQESNRRVACSVQNTRMLPTLKTPGEGWAAGDTGALSRMDERGEMEVMAWLDVNQDAMRPGRRRIVHATRQGNLPRIGGEQVSPAAHAERIEAGYRHTYRLLLELRGEWLRAGGLLDGARSHRVRFIFRDTSLYASLLERCLHPKHLRDGIGRGIELDVLARTLLRNEERPPVWPALRAEREALERMDVPYFDTEAESTTLALPTGEVVPGCFSASALEGAREHLREMSDDDLEFQAAAIRTSFDTLDVLGLRAPERTCSGPRVREDARPDGVAGAAERIADAVLARAHASSPGELAWTGVTYLARSRRHAVGAATLGLADGYTGPALFLAALAAHTGSARYADAAKAALRPLVGRMDELERAARLRRSADIGAGTGLGSAVYALARIGGWLGDAGVLAAAHRVADCITPQAVADDRAFDAVSGSAGAILGLLALHEASGREDLVERAEDCGRHLLAHRLTDPETGAAVWATPHGAETGLAHGQAGIACALRRLAAVRPGSEWIQAAGDAERFELHRLGGGLEGTAAANHTAAWSCGAAGIGLARLDGLRTGEAAPAVVEAAIELTLATLLDGTDDAACGVAGRVDFLLGAGLALGRPELVAAAREGAASLALAAPHLRLVWRHGHFDAGFHLGLSGIGYQLLRTLDPERFPSVLLWS